MYHDYFEMKGNPFSIAPNPDFLFISERHKEALSHLQYGLNNTGGFILLTGEVGTGKTTLARTLLRSLDEQTKVASLLNPQLSGTELLAAVCDGFGAQYSPGAGMKELTDSLQHFLSYNHQQGRSAMLLIDEAQQLSIDALELLRLLTNFETDTQKLLRIVLVGQPELNVMLRQRNLRQLAQRITARYQLLPFTLDETTRYIHYRLQVVECASSPFSPSMIRQIYRLSGGIARLINLICDRALLGAYLSGRKTVSSSLLKQCATELELGAPVRRTWEWLTWGPVIILVVGAFIFGWTQAGPSKSQIKAKQQVKKSALQNEQQWQQVVSLSGNPLIARQLLFKLWGYQIPLSQAHCNLASAVGLRCERGQTTLEQLRAMNYPVVVRLSLPGKALYVVLRHIGTEFTLWLGNYQVDVPSEWFKRHWQGHYLLLWRPLKGGSGVLKQGSQGAGVAELVKALSILNGVELKPQTEFTALIKRQVMIFQKQHHLYPDGVAGIKTMLAITRLLHVNQPSLQEGL
ncbi:MAG: hypothetical protein CENE_02135 [Candidatus Celerinatantimonas neptuna]|nr:MAG: hypothetical protein CENE_02135 [Candidatus Celerinatantimonas neptuna]